MNRSPFYSFNEWTESKIGKLISKSNSKNNTMTEA